MRKYRLILLLLIAAHNIIQAQTPRIDSLRGELGKQKADSIKVHDRIRISWYLADMRDSAQAWKYRNEADSIANKTNNPVLKGIVLEHTGFLYNRQFSKKAISYYLEAQNILQHYPNSMAAKKSMASLGLNIGIEHMNVNDDAGALPYYFDAVKRYEAMDTNHINLSLLYGNIINSYYNLGKYEDALRYCEKAYTKSMATSNLTSKMSASMNYGRVLLKLDRIPESEHYFSVGKHIADSIGSYYFQSKYYQVLGDDEFRKEHYEKALEYFAAALPVIKLTNAPFDIASCYIWMGACNAGIKKFEPAKKYLDSAYTLTKQYDYINLLRDVYLNRYHLYKKAGQYHEAIIQLDSFNVINDSLQVAANADKLQFLDAKYQAEKKEAQINQLQADKEIQRLTLERKNALNYFLVGAALIAALIVLLLFRNFKQKQKLQQQRIAELETQQQLTATEAVLKGEEQERTRLAKDLHDGLGGMLSGIKYSFNTMRGNLIMTPENAQAFERSMDMLDSSIKEMRRVAHNMMPEALVKFGLDTALRDFCNDISGSGALQVSYQSIGVEGLSIDQTTSITIYRIAQELLNNTIKHAAAKTAVVQLTKTGNILSVTVEDDGKGFDTALLKQAKGIGWDNINNRVEFLKGNLDIQSKRNEGTSVHIEINI